MTKKPWKPWIIDKNGDRRRTRAISHPQRWKRDREYNKHRRAWEIKEVFVVATKYKQQGGRQAGRESNVQIWFSVAESGRMRREGWTKAEIIEAARIKARARLPRNYVRRANWKFNLARPTTTTGISIIETVDARTSIVTPHEYRRPQRKKKDGRAQ